MRKLSSRWKNSPLKTQKLEDIEAAKPRLPQRIVFEPDERPGRQGRTTGSRRRSASRDSISSVRRRTQIVSGIPIEFRTLSFQVSESQAIQENEEKSTQRLKGEKKERREDEELF